MILSPYFPKRLLAISLACSLSLISCADNKVSQCQKIILVTQKIAQAGAETRETKEISQVLTMADKFDESAKTMNSLNISDSQLKDYQNAYGEIYHANAEVTRKFIDALQTKDIVTARLMQKQVQDIGEREKTLSNEFNRYCQEN